MKHCGLKHRVHLNDVKLYLTCRTTAMEETNLINILEYGQGEPQERKGGIYNLGGGTTESCNKGRALQLHWCTEAPGVGQLENRRIMGGQTRVELSS